MQPVSAVIITFNEARNIGRCLESLLGVVDEIVVVDSFSSDETQEICAQYGVKFFHRRFDTYAGQKNFANAMATHDLIFSIDADEAPDADLRASILQYKNTPGEVVFTMNRLTNYCGKWVRHSGWYPDRKVRIFDRRQVEWGGSNPHESLQLPKGIEVYHLKGDLLHYSYYTVEEHLARARKYARLGAEFMQESGKKGKYYQLIINPLFKFVRNYFLKRGFLDGSTGFTICRIAALETYWKYRGLIRLQQK